jgi:predicted 2-oxoglutarate/Fe(II)-dependent dioxygenase YbiX
VFASDYGTHRVRGKAGEAVLYPASILHRVEPLLRGTRLVAITWIQSLVRDAAKRKIVFDLAQGRHRARRHRHERRARALPPPIAVQPAQDVGGAVADAEIRPPS